MRVEGRDVRRATVLGYGRTGKALAEFLLSRRVRPFVSEARSFSSEDLDWLTRHEVAHESRGHSVRALEETDLIVPSPGVPWSLPLLAEARRREIPTLSELDLACLSLPPACRVVAVTGTKGKGTTAELVAALLRRAGVNAVVAGNIGVPAISVVDRVTPASVLVLEVSSYQLEQSRLVHPCIAVLTNLSPDHADRHPTWEDYVAVKGRIFRHQTEGETAVLPSRLAHLFPHIRSQPIFYDRVVLPDWPFLEDLAPHKQEDLRAAVAACAPLVPDLDLASLRYDEIRGALLLPFRLHEEGSLNGVRLVNDAKSTNAASTMAALRSFSQPVVLILGGRHKQEGYGELARLIRERPVRRVILYGEATPFLQAVLAQEGGPPAVACHDLAAAFDAALAALRPGDVLLFSPACSSFDQYPDAHARGEHFSRLARSHPSFSPPAESA